MSLYVFVKDIWVGEQWGDGGVYWFGSTPNQPQGLVTGSGPTLTKTKTYSYEDGLVGTSTSATTTILTDTGLALTTNALVGKYLTYTSGPAAGLSMVITANAATTITTAAFGKTPTSGGGDAFVVTNFPLVERGANGTVTNSSDGNLSWVTWTSTF